ncbi:oxidoreductase [Sporosarcina sp. P13]|uniref:DoxX family protein n=1 Tax=Sporosarcina sp. P13 TaxID=2048263 RepID=UPI000C16C0F9|nr:DoxX family protein [Sporosarcina sp. P13]PIC62648.1 oxidoreductase [Sporosarcina sp. P13]
MKRNDAGAVVLRVILGLTFFIHGLSKFQGGIGNTVVFFESLGILGFLAYIVATIELLGGIMLILGLGTRIVSVLFSVIMLGAIFTVKLSAGFLGDGQMAGYELELALLAMAIFLAIANSSSFSLGNKIFRSEEGK